jgi:hypothetical protein
MSAPGLRNFLEGGKPRRATFRKLSEWYVREAAATGTVSDETAQAALAVLLNGVPSGGRQDAAQIVLNAIREAHETNGAPLPAWWDRLQGSEVGSCSGYPHPCSGCCTLSDFRLILRTIYLDACCLNRPFDDQRQPRIRLELEALGFGDFDALHLACAERGGAEVFLTTDDKLLRRAERHAGQLRVRAVNPVNWISQEES